MISLFHPRLIAVALLGLLVLAAVKVAGVWQPVSACKPGASTAEMSAASQPAVSPQPELSYQAIPTDHALIHMVRVPPTGYELRPVVLNGLKTLESFQQDLSIQAAINAGYFDPKNAQTASWIVMDGKTILDPTTNARLAQNPGLATYLPKIFNRSELRVLRCPKGLRYAVSPHQGANAPDCKLLHAIGAGPQLLPALTTTQEAFTDPAAGRDVIGATRRNARSAVGVTADGSLLLVMVAQLPNVKASTGVTLAELADFMKSNGAVQALALDGGSSSTLYYQGQTIYGRYAPGKPQPVKRAVLSAWVVTPRATSNAF